jgi:hypothetical protein
VAVFPAPALILPRRFTSQPQGPVGIDYSNPVCRDLVFAVEGSQGTRDLVKPDFGSFKPTAPMPSGMAQVFGAASPSIYSARQDLAGATAATWQVLFKMSVLGAEIFEQWTGTQRWLVQTPGSIIWVAAQDNAGNRRRWDVTGTQFVVDYWYSLILSWRGGSDASVLLNGTFKTLSSVNAVATAIGTGLPAVRVGSITTTGGSVALARAWRRGLSESEMLSLHANPWQIFKPPSTVKTFLAAPRAPVSNKQSYPLATGSFTKTPSAPFLNVRRKTRTSQPQGPVGIDWGNPITSGLDVAFVNPNERDTFGKTSKIVLGSYTTQAVPIGMACSFGTATTNRIQVASPSLSDGTAYAILAQVISPTSFSSTPQIWTQDDAASSGRINQFRFGASSTVDFIVFNTAGSNFSASTPALASGTAYTILAIATSNGNLEIWVNGVRLATGTYTGTLRSPKNSVENALIGNRFSVSESFNGSIGLLARWSGNLPVNQYSLTTNPWQIFQPDNKPIYVEAP